MIPQKQAKMSFSCGKLATVLIAIVAIWLEYEEIRMQEDHRHRDSAHSCELLKLGEEDPFWEREVQTTLTDLLPVLDTLMDEKIEETSRKRIHFPITSGCINGTLEILPGNDPSYQIGLFKKEKNYPVTVRLARTSFHNDSRAKITSIAVKIHEVEGNQLQLKEFTDSMVKMNKNTFDLITISAPTFPLLVKPYELVRIYEYMTW